MIHLFNWQWLGAAIQGTNSGIVGPLIGAAINKKVEKRSRKYYKEDRENEREYNSPKAQMERLKEAGLNPNNVYGQGGASAVTSTAPQQSPVQPPPEFLNAPVASLIYEAQEQKYLQRKRELDLEKDNITLDREALQLATEDMEYRFKYQGDPDKPRDERSYEYNTTARGREYRGASQHYANIRGSLQQEEMQNKLEELRHNKVIRKNDITSFMINSLQHDIAKAGKDFTIEQIKEELKKAQLENKLLEITEKYQGKLNTAKLASIYMGMYYDLMQHLSGKPANPFRRER